MSWGSSRRFWILWDEPLCEPFWSTLSDRFHLSGVFNRSGSIQARQWLVKLNMNMLKKWLITVNLWWHAVNFSHSAKWVWIIFPLNNSSIKTAFCSNLVYVCLILKRLWNLKLVSMTNMQNKVRRRKILFFKKCIKYVYTILNEPKTDVMSGFIAFINIGRTFIK